MNHSFLEFRPYSGTVESRKYGALVSMENGEALAYSIFNLQDRGVMFCKTSRQSLYWNDSWTTCKRQ